MSCLQRNKILMLIITNECNLRCGKKDFGKAFK